MAEQSLAIGVDYGTNSVRALIVDTASGEELGTGVWEYESGDAGILLDASDPHLARQNPADYQKGFNESVKLALQDAAGVNPSEIKGIGVDTTGSTPLPVDAAGVPLALHPEFKDNLAAHAWLWKDHTGAEEAEEISELARSTGVPYLEKCGGTYSSEWFWSKVLKCRREAPGVFAAAHSWVEVQDYLPAWLCGKSDPDEMARGICAAGHKAMYHKDWGGLPSEEFLGKLDPDLAALRGRLYSETKAVGELAGHLTAERAAECGLAPGTAVSVGAFDAHLGAVGSGIKPGVLVKIMGTSTCDVMVGSLETPDIPGVCGVVPDSVIPGFLGIEAGQSAVGDLFNWCASKLSNGSHEELTAEASKLHPGESGLLALDWNNGNRTILVDPFLTGLLVGQTLHTTAAEIYRAMIEATAFGSKIIIDQIEKFRVPIEAICVAGGIAEKSPLAMQIYSDVLGRKIIVSRSAQTCALGSAIAGAVAGGVYGSVLDGVHAMTGFKDLTYEPTSEGQATYGRLFALYRDLHDAFGKTGRTPDLSGVMKDLLVIRKDAMN